MVTWSSTAPNVATVDANGAITGVGAGTTEIVATAAGKEGRATLVVTPPPVASIVITPASSTLARGANVQLTATLRDATGAMLTGRSVTWSSSDASRILVTSTGLVTAVSIGSATISASSEGRTASVSLTVIVPPIADIDRSSSYAIARDNARASLRDWSRSADGIAGRMQTARAMADLNADGIADAVVAPGVFLEKDASTPLRFYQGIREASGTIGLLDRTAAWVVGNVPSLNHPRKLVFGDYNGDRVLDIYVCAHGYDAPPFPGTTNSLMLSTGQNQWSVSLQPWSSTVGFHHGCASADIDNDGDQDIAVTESNVASYFLINDGRGTFSLSRAGMPTMMNRRAPYYTVEMFDVDGDGYVDMLAGADDQYADSRIFWGDGTGTFTDGRSTRIPAVSNFAQSLTYSSGDMDGDGRPELVVTRARTAEGEFYMGFYVQVLRRTGRDLFDVTAATAAQTNASALTVIIDWQKKPSWMEWVWLFDYDGDARLDLVANSAFFGSLIARGSTTGFGAWTRIP